MFLENEWDEFKGKSIHGPIYVPKEYTVNDKLLIFNFLTSIGFTDNIFFAKHPVLHNF